MTTAVLNTIEERPELCQAFGFMKDGSTVTVSSKGKSMDAHYDTLINEVVIYNNKQLGFTEAGRKDLRPVFKNRVTACAFCPHLRMHRVCISYFWIHRLKTGYSKWRKTMTVTGQGLVDAGKADEIWEGVDNATSSAWGTSLFHCD